MQVYLVYKKDGDHKSIVSVCDSKETAQLAVDCFCRMDTRSAFEYTGVPMGVYTIEHYRQIEAQLNIKRQAAAKLTDEEYRALTGCSKPMDI